MVAGDFLRDVDGKDDVNIDVTELSNRIAAMIAIRYGSPVDGTAPEHEYTVTVRCAEDHDALGRHGGDDLPCGEPLHLLFVCASSVSAAVRRTEQALPKGLFGPADLYRITSVREGVHFPDRDISLSEQFPDPDESAIPEQPDELLEFSVTHACTDAAHEGAKWITVPVEAASLAESVAIIDAAAKGKKKRLYGPPGLYRLTSVREGLHPADRLAAPALTGRGDGTESPVPGGGDE